jgi:hypothetical protein
MILTDFNLHYVKKYPCTFELFWLDGSREEDFQRVFLYKQTLKKFPLLWPYLIPRGHDLNQHYVRKFSCKFEFFWPSGLNKEDF